MYLADGSWMFGTYLVGPILNNNNKKEWDPKTAHKQFIVSPLGFFLNNSHIFY